MKLNLFLLLILCFVKTSAMSSEKYRFFNIQNHDSIPSYYRNLLDRTEQRILILQERYFPDFSSSVRLHVVLISNNHDWEQVLAKYKVPAWSGGIAAIGEKKMFIRVDNVPGEELTITLIHEWVHHALAEKFRTFKIPLWFEEGCAQYFSGRQLSLDNMIFLSRQVLLNRLIPLYRLQYRFPAEEKTARLAYIESLLAVRYMETLLEPNVLDKFFKENPVGFSTFSDYFRSICRYSQDAYESKYLLYLKKKYKFYVILQLENIILIFMVFLLFKSYFVMRTRIRKRIELMEDEEEVN